MDEGKNGNHPRMGDARRVEAKLRATRNCHVVMDGCACRTSAAYHASVLTAAQVSHDAAVDRKSRQPRRSEGAQDRGAGHLPRPLVVAAAGLLPTRKSSDVGVQKPWMMIDE